MQKLEWMDKLKRGDTVSVVEYDWRDKKEIVTPVIVTAVGRKSVFVGDDRYSKYNACRVKSDGRAIQGLNHKNIYIQQITEEMGAAFEKERQDIIAIMRNTPYETLSLTELRFLQGLVKRVTGTMTKLVEVTTYHGMTAMVNPDNPGFNGYFPRRRPKKHIEVFAIISNGVKSWREKFKVTSWKVVEEQIKEVIKFFNDTRRPGDNEKERSFVELYQEDVEVSKYDDDVGMSGWLDPDGKFHPCGFGEHIEYALELAEKSGERFRCMGSEYVEDLSENQHIPMSTWGQSSGSFISILGQLTPAQVEWFNRFFFKLSTVQRAAVSRTAEEQGITLKYDW